MALEVVFDGDITPLQKKIKEAEFELKELSKQKAADIKLGLDTKEATAQIKDLKKYLSDLKTTNKDVGDSFSKLTPKIANGGNALTQFSRIAQDAPFGIMGIGNNITATAEAFGGLVKETGSAGGALKAVASSIMGTGGILLAVSLVTTALTYMSQSGLTLEQVFQKLGGTFDQAANDMMKINAEAQKGAAEQISSVGAYVSAAKNINLSMSDRLIAVRKLQDEYPAYFGNLTKEQILNGAVTGAVKEVTAALIAKAKAAALSSKLADLAEKEFLLRQKETEGIKKLKEAYKALNATSTGGGTFGATGQFGEGRLSAAKSSLGDIQDELRSIIATQKLYTSEIEKSVAASIKLDTTVAKSGKAKKIGNTNEPIKKFGGSELDTTGIKAVAKEYEVLDNGIIQVAASIKTSMKGINVAFDTSGIAMLETLQKFNEDANALIAGSLTSTFSNLGTAIGEALANGENVFSAIGNSLLASLGSFISDMGDLLIKYGALAIAKGYLDTAIATGGPAAVIAGGAAIAVGIALKAAGAAIGAKAKSGGGGGSPQTGADYSSPSQSVSSGGGGGMGGGTVVFEINGTSLIGVLNNTLDKNTRLGGNLPIG